MKPAAVTLLLNVALCGFWGSQTCAETVETRAYKTIGDHSVHADVYPSNGAGKRPAVVWIHGGALIMGHRQSVPRRVREFCRANNYVLVSIDYRLAPETKLPEIIADLEDAFAWVRNEAAQSYGVDPDRVAVMGGSAGGYLTLTAGYRVKPRPTVLLAYWGYGDLVGDWYSQPSPHARHRTTQMSREQAWAQVSGPPISDARQRDGNGGAFYQYCRRTGTWPQAVSDWDPHREPTKFHPYMPVRNVTPEYPPTFMIHGTADTDVPHEQSVMMAAELKRHGVEHRLISIQGGEHGLGGGDPDKIATAHAAASEFVRKQLEK